MTEIFGFGSGVICITIAFSCSFVSLSRSIILIPIPARKVKFQTLLTKVCRFQDFVTCVEKRACLVDMHPLLLPLFIQLGQLSQKLNRQLASNIGTVEGVDNITYHIIWIFYKLYHSDIL